MVKYCWGLQLRRRLPGRLPSTNSVCKTQMHADRCQLAKNRRMASCRKAVALCSCAVLCCAPQTRLPAAVAFLLHADEPSCNALPMQPITTKTHCFKAVQRKHCLHSLPRTSTTPRTTASNIRPTEALPPEEYTNANPATTTLHFWQSPRDANHTWISHDGAESSILVIALRAGSRGGRGAGSPAQVGRDRRDV